MLTHGFKAELAHSDKLGDRLDREKGWKGTVDNVKAIFQQWTTAVIKTTDAFAATQAPDKQSRKYKGMSLVFRDAKSAAPYLQWLFWDQIESYIARIVLVEQSGAINYTQPHAEYKHDLHEEVASGSLHIIVPDTGGDMVRAKGELRSDMPQTMLRVYRFYAAKLEAIAGSESDEKCIVCGGKRVPRSMLPDADEHHGAEEV